MLAVHRGVLARAVLSPSGEPGRSLPIDTLVRVPQVPINGSWVIYLYLDNPHPMICTLIQTGSLNCWV